MKYINTNLYNAWLVDAYRLGDTDRFRPYWRTYSVGFRIARLQIEGSSHVRFNDSQA